MTACTHSTVIEYACNSQPKRIHDTSPILSHQSIINDETSQPPQLQCVGKRSGKSLVS